MNLPRFLLDENVDPDVEAGLRNRGVDAIHIRELGMTGATDDAVIDIANQESRVLVTHDLKDFARLGSIFRSAVTESPGVLLISPSIAQGHPGALIYALATWAQDHPRDQPIPGGIAWLIPAERLSGEGGRVRERPPAYLAALQRLAALQAAGQLTNK